MMMMMMMIMQSKSNADASCISCHPNTNSTDDWLTVLCSNDSVTRDVATPGTSRQRSQLLWSTHLRGPDHGRPPVHQRDRRLLHRHWGCHRRRWRSLQLPLIAYRHCDCPYHSRHGSAAQHSVNGDISNQRQGANFHLLQVRKWKPWNRSIANSLAQLIMPARRFPVKI